MAPEPFAINVEPASVVISDVPVLRCRAVRGGRSSCRSQISLKARYEQNEGWNKDRKGRKKAKTYRHIGTCPLSGTEDRGTRTSGGF